MPPEKLIEMVKTAFSEKKAAVIVPKPAVNASNEKSAEITPEVDTPNGDAIAEIQPSNAEKITENGDAVKNEENNLSTDEVMYT